MSETTVSKRMSLEDRLAVSGLLIPLVTHFSTVAISAYRGFMAGKGIDVNVPVEPVILLNVLGTAFANAENNLSRYVTHRRLAEQFSLEKRQYILKYGWEALRNAEEDASKGAIIGGILTPLEIFVGYSIGHSLATLDKVF